MNELLKIENLTVCYFQGSQAIPALTGVNLEIDKGSIVGLVGESGCGKTTLAKSIVSLLPGNAQILSGKIIYQGKNLLDFNDRQISQIRGREIGYIFQDPSAALNPVITIGNQLIETIRHLRKVPENLARNEAKELLDLVKVPEPGEILRFFPHQLSGGMNQRIMIALTLACQPRLLICDEPTSNLDVTIAASILQLLLELKKKLNLSIIFITHDLSLIRFFAESVAVLYQGRLVEFQETSGIFNHPKDNYTRDLIAASFQASSL
jgi:ABC-type dipeptide/oligopeptide/nickel transport system ATPase component